MITQLWDLSVTIGGTDVTDIVRCSTQFKVDAGSAAGGIASATITTATKPADFANGAEVVIMVAVPEGSADRFIGDYVRTQGRLAADGSQQWTITATGILKRLTRKYNHPAGARVYNYQLTDAERVDAAVIRNLIEAMGIDASRHEIFESEWENPDGPEEPPVQWLLGQIQDVVLEVGQAPINLIDLIDEPPGFATYDQPGGYIQRARYRDDYADLTAVDATFVEGADGVTIDRLGRDIEGIINRWTVRGRSYKGLIMEATAQAESDYIDSLYPPEMQPAYEGQSLQTDLLESQHLVTQCAAIKVQDTNHPKDGLRIVLVGHEFMLTSELQLTIGAQYTSLGIPTTSHHRIIELSDDWDCGQAWTWTQTLGTNGGTLV